MATSTAKIAAKLCLIGTVLILANVLVIAYNGAPIVLSSYPVSTVEELTNPGQQLWFRISFGVQSFVSGPAIILWGIISVIALISAVLLYRNPDRPMKYGPIIFILSILSFLAGGGFIIGSLIAILGSGIGFQWKNSLGETFFGKLFRVARLDSKVFLTIKDDQKLLRTAAILLIFINILSGLGNNIYTINVEAITSSLTAASKILLLGETVFAYGGQSMFYLSAMYIGLSVLKWVLLSLLIYILGSKLLGRTVEFDAVARVTAFAYTPVILQIFMPFVFTNQPFLTAHWPLLVVLVTNLWMIFALIIGIGTLFQIGMRKALGTMLLVGPIYWILTYEFLLPLVFPFGEIPGFVFILNPIQMVFTLFSISVLLSFFLGAFSKR
jgi:hypothetical protein